jgi:glycosyltransferase involved in cell wall biosynthesis
VCRDIHVWAPAFRAFGGGIGAFSRELVFALAGSGARVRLFGRDDRDGEWQGLPVQGSGVAPLAIRKLAFACRLLLALLLRRPGLVVTTHVNFAPVALLGSYLLGTRYVVVAHGVEIGPALSGLRKRALRRADSVWAVSRWTRDRCVMLGVAQDDVQVISNTVDAGRFDLGQDRVALRARHGIEADAKVLLTVARLDPGEQYKGYDTVIRALPALQAAVGPVCYLVVGAGGDLTRAQALVASLGVGDAVRFCGFVTDAELPDYYRIADVFAMPSCGEGFGIVFLEAMACGVPVIGGDQDGTRDALADGALGMLADPGDSDALASALQQLLSKEGPEVWFTPASLRAACLETHGRAAFSRRVSEALATVAGDFG